MRIALVGYGKMGKAIAQVALQKGYEISYKIDRDNEADIQLILPENTDVAIEFTGPETALSNIRILLNNKVNTISGSTGWADSLPEMEALAEAQQVGFLWASNYSIGVNLFFKLNSYLAKLMQQYPAYHAEVTEIHHTQKLDKPSGTAITIADQIIETLPGINSWSLDGVDAGALPIFSIREDPAPGTHTVIYQSVVDDLEIKHTAHTRDGFANGAVLAATFMKGKVGVFSMEDVLFG